VPRNDKESHTKPFTFPVQSDKTNIALCTLAALSAIVFPRLSEKQKEQPVGQCIHCRQGNAYLDKLPEGQGFSCLPKSAIEILPQLQKALFLRLSGNKPPNPLKVGKFFSIAILGSITLLTVHIMMPYKLEILKKTKLSIKMMGIPS
jgi:hypothetical protein